MKGVTKANGENLYRARIRHKGKLIYVGSSHDPNEAYKMYLEARAKMPDGRMKKEKEKIKKEKIIPEIPELPMGAR